MHDDVVDESTERRGQLSVNAIFNNKVAVLTGDYLLATSLVHAELTNSHRIIQLVSTLGQDLADGELLQLSNVSNHSFSEEVYFDVIRKKTAALFAACTKAAAFSVGVEMCIRDRNKSDKIRFDITNRSDGQTGTQVSVYIPFRFSYDL